MRFAGARVAPRALARLADVAMRRSLLDAVDRSAPDALLAHGVLPWGDVVRSVASETGLPFAFVEHSAEDVLRLRRGTALARYYRSASRGARAVLAVGRPMVRHLREELSLTNISFLPNGTQLPPDPGALHPRPAAVRNKLLLLAAGHYYPRKGFEVLVDAFAKIAERHPRAVLRIVTDAPPALQRRVAGHGLGKRLQIMPTMDQALLQRWMSWSDLFVLPSWAEAFALVGIEAMAAGTPVVLTRDCGLASMIRPVRNGRPDESRHGWVVEPHRADALAATLDEALHHERWLARLGEAGRKLVVSTFTWHRNGRIILDALQPRSVLRCSA
jgi:glycosyltransferase involved in cell wall biosynthesis